MSQKQKRVRLAIASTSVAIVAAFAIGLYLTPIQNGMATEIALDEDKETLQALETAREYLISSPTFEFDGIPESIDVITVNKLESFPVQYRIEIAFDSSHAGFGNREGQMLAQVITPHTIEILVSKGKVVSAVTDNIWDESNHQYVLKNPQSKLTSSDKPVTPFSGKVTDVSSLSDAIKSRGLSAEIVDELDDSMFSVPAKVIAVGGAEIQVYEFDNVSDAEIAKSLISEDGTEIGLSIIRWMDTPHFYAQGKIIVQYIGHNPELVNLLDSLLGKQFAGM